MNLVTVRKIVSLSLLVSWIVTGVTGYMLSLAKLGIALNPLVPRIHEYAGFVALGLSIIHIYLNMGALKSYLRPRKRTK